MRRRILGGNIRTPVNTTPNTFIGGVSATINSPSVLASTLNTVSFPVTANDIGYFSINGSNIEAAVNVFYVLKTEAFKENQAITYYKDNGKVLQVLLSVFYNCDSLTEADFPEATLIANGAFAFANNVALVKIPKCTNLGGTIGNDNVFVSTKTTLQITCPVSLQTNNNGSPDGDLTYVTGRGGTVIYI